MVLHEDMVFIKSTAISLSGNINASENLITIRRVYLPGASKEFPQAIIANVWNWDKLWKVEWMEDGKLMGEMTQYTAYDPLAEKMCQEAVQTYSWIAPVKTNHLFKAIPQNPQAQISVKITDRFGHEYIQSAQDFSSFFLQYQK